MSQRRTQGVRKLPLSDFTHDNRRVTPKRRSKKEQKLSPGIYGAVGDVGPTNSHLTAQQKRENRLPIARMAASLGVKLRPDATDAEKAAYIDQLEQDLNKTRSSLTSSSAKPKRKTKPGWIDGLPIPGEHADGGHWR